MIPPFVSELRAQVGAASLMLVGISSVILRSIKGSAPQILLVRPSGSDIWEPVNGIMEPLEQPAQTAVREAFEEAGVRIRVNTLAAVRTEQEKTFPNGDRAVFLNILFRCEWLEGEPQPVDDEIAQAAWFELHALPQVSPTTSSQIIMACEVTTGAWFENPSS